MEAVRKAIEDYVAREVKRAVESCISIIEGRTRGLLFQGGVRNPEQDHPGN